jgi:hypothetical protein
MYAEKLFQVPFSNDTTYKLQILNFKVSIMSKSKSFFPLDLVQNVLIYGGLRTGLRRRRDFYPWVKVP